MYVNVIVGGIYLEINVHYNMFQTGMIQVRINI